MKYFNVPSEISIAVTAALGELQPRRDNAQQFADEARQVLASALTDDVVNALGALTEQRDRDAALLLRGLVSIGPALPPTPRDGEGFASRQWMPAAEGAILGIATFLGEPIAYRAEKAGELVQNVFPVRGEEHSPSNEGSATPLGLHTELAFSREHPDGLRDGAGPDFLLLLCLRADPRHQAVTLVVEGRDLLDGLAPELGAVLREPRFELRAPYSFTRDADGSRPWVGPSALVRGEEQAPELSLDLACGTRGLDDEAEQALTALQRHAERADVRTELRLGAGDLVVLDNKRCMHGRSSFVPSYDGRDRWLQRLYVRRVRALTCDR